MSFKAKLMIGLIKHRHLLKGKLKREVIDENYDYEAFRASIRKSVGRMNGRLTDIKVEETDINGIHIEILEPDVLKSEKLLFYIHGGGFVSGDAYSHRPHVSKFSKALGMRAVCFDYRLAPEHPFPAAIEDCEVVYMEMLKKFKSENIVLIGESAGGTLALSLVNALKEKGYALPNQVVSISPLVNMNCNYPSFTTNAKKDVATYGSYDHWIPHYVGLSDRNDPILSPLFGDLQNLPKTLIVVGTYEVHYDDARAYYEKASAARSQVVLKEYSKMVHAFPLLSPFFKEAKEAFNDIVDFIEV